MQERRHPDPVEDYTVPFLVSAGVLLFIAFFAITVAAGFVWALATAALIDAGIRRLPRQEQVPARRD